MNNENSQQEEGQEQRAAVQLPSAEEELAKLQEIVGLCHDIVVDLEEHQEFLETLIPTFDRYGFQEWLHNLHIPDIIVEFREVEIKAVEASTLILQDGINEENHTLALAASNAYVTVGRKFIGMHAIIEDYFLNQIPRFNRH